MVWFHDSNHKSTLVSNGLALPESLTLRLWKLVFIGLETSGNHGWFGFKTCFSYGDLVWFEINQHGLKWLVDHGWFWFGETGYGLVWFAKIKPSRTSSG